MNSPILKLQECTDLGHILAHKATTQPNHLAFTFLEDGMTPSQAITYGALHSQAQVISHYLQSCLQPGNRALLMFPPGLEFVSAFFGCLYAGIIAVPTPELDPLRAKRVRPRLCAIAEDSEASALLTTRKLFSGSMDKLEELSKIPAGKNVFIEDISLEPLSEKDQHPAFTNEIAFLQYTSGSTASPKGVIVTQQCLLQQLNALTYSCGLHDESIALNWMPHFHDYGLVNGLLLNVYLGTHTYLMAPMRFLRTPMAWLEAITKFRITHSSGPNFAYDLCVTNTSPEERIGLDLQNWSFASCGAEPIRMETMNRFIETFEPFGFHKHAFAPAYGLAEYTLAATVTPHGSMPSHVTLDAQALEKGSIVSSFSTEPAIRKIVCCGTPIQGADLRIIDQKTLCHSPPDTIGEIWLAGPSVAEGYWHHPKETEETFNAYTADTCEGPFLRTGDLGFLKEGNLYVTGRLKDLIIIRGHNYFPQDIEETVQGSHPALQQGATAAFCVANGGDEQLVIVQEVRHRKQVSDFEDLISVIRQAVSSEHNLPVYAILLVKTGSVPKTTSGKIQRQLCKETFLSQRIHSLYTSILQPPTSDLPELPPIPIFSPNASQKERQQFIEDFVKRQLAQRLNIPPSSLTSEQHLNELGIDSLLSAQLTCQIEQVVGVAPPPSLFLQHLTIEDLGKTIQEQLLTQREALPPDTEWRGIPDNEYVLSPNQKAQWFLSQLDPQSPAANVAVVLRIRSPLDQSAVQRALHHLVRRHAILRTIYEIQSGVPYQHILPSMTIPLDSTCVRKLDWETVKQKIRAASQKPFDLSKPPLLRAHLFERDSTHHLLLLTTHHIAADGWSMRIIFDDFVQSYLRDLGKDQHTDATTAMTSTNYVAFSRWQTHLLEGPEGQRLWEFWKNRLVGQLPRLLLTHRPTELPISTPRAGSQNFSISLELTQRLHALAKRQGVTLYALLLGVFQVLLHRYTEQDDLLICTPMSGRIRPEHLTIVGNLTNTVPLREHLGGNPPFHHFLRQVSQTVAAAIDHQLYPFSLLVERLRAEHKASQLPIHQILFVLQSFTLFDDLHDPQDMDHEHQATTMAPFVIPQPIGQFDLTLEIAENGSALTGHFEYNCDLFEFSFMQRLASHYQILLDGVSTSPEHRIWEFPLCQSNEKHRILVEWNPPPLRAITTSSIHELIEHQVQQSPHTIALATEHSEVTYEELNARANQIAHSLRSAGIRPEMAVGICIDPSIEMIVSILAILKADGAYVPLDPKSPKSHLTAILEDIRPSHILTTRNLKHILPEGPWTLIVLDEPEHKQDFIQQPVTNLIHSAEPKNLAYVIYTSGSTGKPKGVEIEHLALVEFALSFRQECDLKNGDRVLQFSSLAFDASVEEIFPFLISGGTIVLPTEMTLESPDRFLSKCHALNITVLDLPTAFWHEIALHLEHHATMLPPSLRLMIIGGEKASPRAVHSWLKKVRPSIRLVNTYGPTETTVTATIHTLNNLPQEEGSQSGTIPIGRPLAHIKTYLLDPHHQPVPIGIPGELYLGGRSLARGYHNREEETGRQFIPNPFCEDEGSRLFKTGDVCRYRPDGVLEYLGRTDHQVKIRGFRVELGEIEAIMQEHDGVYEALVTLDSHTPYGPRLMAYFIPVRQPGIPIRELRTFLKERLPDYMIPSSFLAIDSWPRTSSGKIDRSQLPTLEESSWETKENYVPPRDPMEEAIAEWYGLILGLNRVSIHAHFFELGGHSLLAVQLISRLRDLFQCDIPLRILFENPIVADLAEAIQVLQKKEPHKGEIPCMVPIPKNCPLPLSSSQERIYFLHKLAPQSAAYNIPVAIRLQGQLNHQTLEDSLNQLIQKHESLRTGIREESGKPSQVISSMSCLKLTYIDLRQMPPDQRMGYAREKADETARLPFDLRTPPLMRATLLHLDDHDYVLVMTVHHIVSDQWSFAILGKELGQFYNALCQGQPITQSSSAFQYADFACWQRQWLTSEKLDEQYSYWMNQLSDLPILELPTDHPRLPEQTFSGTHISLDLTKPLLNKLQVLSANENATLYMLCLATFTVLLYRYTGQTDIAIGSPVANRHWPSVEDIVGTFVNTLVLRTNVSGDPTFRELLQRVRQIALDGYANQDLPFEKLVQDLAPSRTSNRMPLVQVLFNFGNAPFERVKFTGLSLSPFEIDRKASQFDLSVSIDTMFSGKVFLEFNTDLFDPNHMSLMLNHYRELLQSVVAFPDNKISTLNMLTPAEKQQILVEWNITDSPFPKHLSALDIIEIQATRNPEAIAILARNASLTYRELDEQATACADALRQLGVTPDSPVGVAINRSSNLPVALLGIMKAGGCYLPLDPHGPPERLTFMLSNSQTTILVTQTPFTDNFSEYHGQIFHLDDIERTSKHMHSRNLPKQRVRPSDLAYVIYTSGSTGQPKGVEITHRSLVNFLYSMSRKLGVTNTDVFLAVTPITFDIAALELFLPLSVGARVILLNEEEVRDGHQLIEILRTSGATVMQATPATWHMLIQAGWEGNKDLKILSGGEALSRELAEKLLTRSREVWNLYGPTETTIWSTAHKVRTGNGPVSIGRPIDNTRTLILDKQFQLTPIGIPGELYIGGEGVARGYRGRPDLTTERFRVNPFWPTERLYKTGDIAKWKPDGCLDYLGRIDHQVKIRGVRIELQEIESRLNQLPEIHQSVVLVLEASQVDKKLIAFIQADPNTKFSPETVQNYLREYLPAAMIPSEFIFLTEFPLTPNGKLDRQALLRLRGQPLEHRNPSARPENELQRQLISIWERLLDIQGIGIDDHYFDLGGHSILALQLFTEIEQVTGIRLPLATLFKAPTIRQLALFLQNTKQPTSWQSLVPINPLGTKPPLFAIPGIGGNVVDFYGLAQLLGQDQPFYGLQAQGLDGKTEPFITIEEIATHYVTEIQSVQPTGPYFLVGACIGGIIAFEIAHRLSAQGHQIALLAMLETWHPVSLREPGWTLPNFLRAPAFFLSVSYKVAAYIIRTNRNDRWARINKAASGLREMILQRDVYRGDREVLFRDKVSEANRKAAASYRPKPLACPIKLIIASERPVNPPKDTRLSWCKLALGGHSVDQIAAHDTGHLFRNPHVTTLAEKLKTLLAQARE